MENTFKGNLEPMESEKGEVIDLSEKKKRGELTSKEAVQELLRRGLGHEQYPMWINWIMIPCMMGWTILCLISKIAAATHIPMLEPLPNCL